MAYMNRSRERGRERGRGKEEEKGRRPEEAGEGRESNKCTRVQLTNVFFSASMIIYSRDYFEISAVEKSWESCSWFVYSLGARRDLTRSPVWPVVSLVSEVSNLHTHTQEECICYFLLSMHPHCTLNTHINVIWDSLCLYVNSDTIMMCMLATLTGAKCVERERAD